MSRSLQLLDNLLLELESSTPKVKKSEKKVEMSEKNQLDQLSSMTIVVADTGDIEAMKKYKPTDATTNPSLVLKALNKMKENDEKEYESTIKIATDYAKKKSNVLSEQISFALDRLTVEFGKRILSIIPGYVSSELDPRLSFDIDACVKRAQRIISIYEECGIKNAKDRILIKIASTWEGINASKVLNNYNIKCNMTLLFSIWQAAAAAQIGNSFLISPFVGRISDWHKKQQNVNSFKISDDPGPKSVVEIYRYYKTFNFKTIVMGASFRNKEQILELSGCDRLTIGPKFLDELQKSNEKIVKKLDKSQKSKYNKLINVTESNFRYGMCSDAMATEKLAEGIRKFAADTIKLEKVLEQKLKN